MELEVVGVLEREGVDPVGGVRPDLRARVRRREVRLDAQQLAVEGVAAQFGAALDGEFHQGFRRQHPRQRVRQFEGVEHLDRLRLFAAHQRVDAGPFHGEDVFGVRELAPQPGKLHPRPQHVEARAGSELQPVARQFEPAFAGRDRLLQHVPGPQAQQVGVQPRHRVPGDPVLHLLEVRLGDRPADVDAAERRPQAEAPHDLRGLEVPEVGAEGEGAAEIARAAAEWRGARVVDEPGKEGAVPEAGVAGLGELEVEVELRQVGGARLPDQHRELREPLAVEPDVGVQLRSHVHRLGDGEGERLLGQQVPVLIQDPVGDRALPQFARALGARGRGQQRQHDGDGRGPAAGVTGFERLHRFSFRRSPFVRRVPDRARPPRDEPIPARLRATSPVRAPAGRPKRRTIRRTGSTIQTVRVFRRTLAAGAESQAAVERRCIPAEPRRSRRSSLRFGRNTSGIPPSHASSAVRLAVLGAHVTSSTGCSPVDICCGLPRIGIQASASFPHFPHSVDNPSRGPARFPERPESFP